jgi:hypothetical protein
MNPTLRHFAEALDGNVGKQLWPLSSQPMTTTITYTGDQELPICLAGRLVQNERRVMSKLEFGGTDRRLWSTTANGLSRIMSALGESTYFLNTHDLRRQLIASRTYPARDFERYCVPQPPDVFITYDWQASVIDIQNAVWGGMDYLGSVMERLDLVDDAEPIIADEIRIWIDWIFIDQNDRDIEAELDVLPDIIDACGAHYVLSSTALTRAWCCWEIARFNQRFKDDTAVPRSLMAPQPAYEGWANTKAFDDNDKRALEERIHRDIPGGMHTFEMMMLIVGHVSNMEGIGQTGAAVENLEIAARRWIQRMHKPSGNA